MVPAAKEDSLAYLLQSNAAAAVALGLGMSEYPIGKLVMVAARIPAMVAAELGASAAPSPSNWV